MIESRPQYSGKIVALEGLTQDALEIQLRLLPSSPHILVLPSLQKYLEDDCQDARSFAPSIPSTSLASYAPSSYATSKPENSSSAFDARRYVRSICAAAAARQAIALDFLENDNICGETHSTLTPPQKTVFLNGGTASSHALCIEAIREHDAAAGGGLEQAALIFDKLIENGFAGLRDEPTVPSMQERSRFNVAVLDGDDSPMTKAMRAADALDHKTESLQPSTHIFDPTITNKPRSRSLSLPVYEENLALLNADRQDNRALASNLGSRGDSRIHNLTQLKVSTQQSVSSTPSANGSVVRSVSLGPAPRGRTTCRYPSCARGQINDTKALLRDNDMGETLYYHQCHQSQTQRARSLEHKLPAKTDNTALCVDMDHFFRASSRETSSVRPQPSSSTQRKIRASNRDISTSRNSIDCSTGVSPNGPVFFEPFFPLIEDIVIRFDDDESSTLKRTSALDLAIQKFRDTEAARRKRHDNSMLQDVQSIQTQTVSLLGRRTTSSALPETPVSSSHGYSSSTSSTASSSRACTTADPIARTSSMDDYDPFAPHEYNAGPKPPLPFKSPVTKQRQASQSIETPDPLTPARSPSPMQLVDDELDDSGTRFHVLATAKFSSILALHNALRSSLRTFFSQKDTRSGSVGEHSAENSVENPISDTFFSNSGSASNNLWVPLFETAHQTKAKEQSSVRATNFVLAVGNQHDVPFDLMSKITGRLDALGCQSDIGITRGGRLDIRYLIANAMQTLKAQKACNYGNCAELSSLNWPATSMSSPTSLSSTRVSYALATLVIAQLDLYLRSCPTSSPSLSAARLFLLDYPSELLPVVLALRQLMGQNMVQVATVIVNSDPKYQKDGCHQSFQALPQAPLSSQSKLFSSLGYKPLSKEPLYMSADYLLTSAAGGIDIAKFVAAVRKKLLLSVMLTPGALPTTANTVEATFPHGLVPLNLASPQNKKTGRYSVSSTVSSAAGNLGANGYTGSIDSKLQSPTHANDPMLSPTLLSPPTVNSISSPRHRASMALENEKRYISTSSGITRPHPRPLPLKIFLNGPTTYSASATLPVVSPALSCISMQSMQSQASSLQSYQSQSEPWYTVAKATGYMVAATALAPAPVLHPNGRLVAKEIQVHGPAAARRAKEHQTLEEVLAHSSGISISSAQSDRGNFGNLESPGLSCDEDYVLDISRLDNDNLRRTIPRNSVRNSSATTQAHEFAHVNMTGTGDYSDSHNDEEYESGPDEDDFENDPDMRRLMPLFMRDRAALLAAKEAAGVRDVRPTASRMGMSQQTRLAAPRPGSVSAARAASASPQQSMASLRGKASTNSIHSQYSQHGNGSLTSKSGHEGRKALKWLGLA
ncbi:MAG: hypothetical protein SEPTF4163_001925 [Sporothrix epigloea]